MNSHYYDYPEGEDISGKMIAANRFAGTAGVVYATMDILMLSKPRGYVPTIMRFAVVTGPFLALASSFTLGTYLATKLRSKDDQLNYAIGGICAGGALGAIKSSVVGGMSMGVIFAIAACVKKLSKEEGWEFFPDSPRSTYGLRNHDLTLMADRERNWTAKKS